MVHVITECVEPPRRLSVEPDRSVGRRSHDARDAWKREIEIRDEPTEAARAARRDPFERGMLQELRDGVAGGRAADLVEASAQHALRMVGGGVSYVAP